MVASWEGKTTQVIALELECHPQTVRERVSRFNRLDLDGLQDVHGRGRKARLTEQERSTIVSLIGQAPPGQLVREGDGERHAADEQGEAHWTLDALTRVAQAHGIRVKRSQTHRIFLQEGPLGGKPAHESTVLTQPSSQKDTGRYALQAPTAKQPAHRSICTGLVA